MIRKASKPKPAQAAKSVTPARTWSKLKSSLNALPDSIDIRDWIYQPSLLPVPPVLVNCHLVPEILDQGQADDGLPRLIIAGANKEAEGKETASSQSASHGGFDNDVATMNSVLYRILGAAPARPFSKHDLNYD